MSEDEAAIMHGLPQLFREDVPWTPEAPMNRMVSAAVVKKSADAFAEDDAEE